MAKSIKATTQRSLLKAGLLEGFTYVVCGMSNKMIAGMDYQSAFNDACEDENFYGDRPDVVADRRAIANFIRQQFGIKVRIDQV